jgi:hypothetical protein
MYSPHLRCHNTCVITVLWLLITYHSDLTGVNTLLQSHQANASGNWQVMKKQNSKFQGTILNSTLLLAKKTIYKHYIMTVTNRKVAGSFQMVSLEFFIDIILPIALWP